MRHMWAVAVLTLLLIITPSNSAHSSLKRESVISNHGTVLFPDNFADTIFFEYGAESEQVQPPWDQVNGDGVTYGLVEVSTTQVRTGTKAVRLYQKSPPKNDEERRCALFYYGTSHQKSEGYLSWWVYIDSNLLAKNPDWGPNLGGWQMWWGPPDDKTQWWEALRFLVHNTSKRIQCSYIFGRGKPPDRIRFHPDAWALSEQVLTNYDMDDYLNKWVHLEVYWKIHITDGAVKGWINEDLVFSKTGIKTDPRAYPSWNDNSINHEQCQWRDTCEGGYPNLQTEMYAGQNSFEHWIWVDDIVGATEKVPESYGVVDK